MTEKSTKLAPSLLLWKKLIEHATSKMPSFRFMVHDQWANVLFLHWRIPEHLEATLDVNTDPFAVERYDGSAWIGLILLTEENVGPSICRSQWTCLTHHGINVRTYVKGGGGGGESKTPQTARGIHFSSLECDDEFTAFGANIFGMPYKIAKMKRSYAFFKSDRETTESREQTSDSTSSSSRCYYKIRSERLPSCSSSFFRILFHSLNSWWPRLFRSTETEDNLSDPISKATSNNNNILASSLSSERFTVDCSWSRPCSDEDNNRKENISDSKAPSEDDAVSETLPTDEPFCEWATERYFVYTHKYGKN